MLKEQRVDHATEPTLDDLREALVAGYGTDYGAHDPTWISRFTDATRQATSYRAGRVLLAGDAAHIHSPHGGQGLNTGVQDAVNLGWKLAQVVNGTSPDSLLDTYHAERHPVAARVLQNTMAQVALTTPDDRHDALRAAFAELLAIDEPRKRIAAMLTGLDIHYDLGEGHPLLGRRMPDLDLHTADGPTRVYALLHEARPVLLYLGEHGRLRHRPMGRPSPVDRGHPRRRLGAPGPRPGPSAHGGAHPPRRTRRVGRSRPRPDARRDTLILVRGSGDYQAIARRLLQRAG